MRTRVVQYAVQTPRNRARIQCAFGGIARKTTPTKTNLSRICPVPLAAGWRRQSVRPPRLCGAQTKRNGGRACDRRQPKVMRATTQKRARGTQKVTLCWIFLVGVECESWCWVIWGCVNCSGRARRQYNRRARAHFGVFSFELNAQCVFACSVRIAR